MFSNKKLAVAVSGAVLLMAGQFALADSTTDIVDALVSKGVLTEEEGKLISKGHETKKKADGTLSFKDGFKLNSGDGKSTMGINGRIQADYRNFDTATNAAAGAGGASNSDTFAMRRTYLGVKGTFRGWINYEATFDASGDKGSASGGTGASLKYYWLETAFSDAFKIRFGQYKMPMGLEQLTSSRFIDFTERDWVATLAPAVNKGVMIHGVPMSGLTYAVSVSNGGMLADEGAGMVQETANNGDGKSYNMRVTANIPQLLGNKDPIIGHLGGSYGYDNDLAAITGSNIKFSTNGRGTQFFTAGGSEYTNADIRRFGLEGIGAYGPLKLQAEYASLEFQQNQGKSLAGTVDVPDREINAWYAGASYMITGENYSDAYKNGLMDRMSPKNNYTGFGSSGMGAWEIGARYSRFDAKDFNTGSSAITAGTSSADVKSYSAGIKWIIDPNTRFLADYIFTDFNRDITGSNTNGTMRNEKAINMRAQFDF
jgi:phosphate-selective porin OprO/OprP